jgi:proline iminopeptidase
MEEHGHHVSIGDIRLYVVERGAASNYPLLCFHGGPGLDHHMFGDYLDALTDQFQLILVDERGQGLSDKGAVELWTLPQMAKDVMLLADALGLDKYAVLGHSYGSFIALQNAVDFPANAAQTIISSGVPSARFLMSHVNAQLAAFEPTELREQVTSSWAREPHAQTQADVEAILHDQNAFQFANPTDPRIAEFEKRTAGATYAPDVLSHFAKMEYGGIEVEERLNTIPQPLLVLAGRGDRTCSVAAAEAIAQGAPKSELVIFEESGHMTYVEENQKYVQTVRAFLNRTR